MREKEEARPDWPQWVMTAARQTRFKRKHEVSSLRLRPPRHLPLVANHLAMKSSVLLVCFTLFWLMITGLGTFFVGRDIYRQIRATGFANTTGLVTSSKITVHHGKGTTYGVDIRYTYTIAGKTFPGTNYRYGQISSSDSAWAKDAVRQHPVGTLTTVYYDQDKPEDSVLSPGINGGDLFFLLFLTPFNLIGLGLVSALVISQWQKIYPTEAGGVKWHMEGMRFCVRLAECSPTVWGLAAFGVAAFAGIFVIGFSAGFHPTIPVMEAGWGTVLGVGLAVALWQWRKQTSGATDLVIEQEAGTVELPATSGRKQRELIPLTELQGVEVAPVQRQAKRSTYLVYFVTLRLRDGRVEKLREWTEAAPAEDFAEWLREKLNLRA
jgi:hypothetical protein